MKHYRDSLTFILLFVVQITLGQIALGQTEVPDGFESLFNGKDLDGWTTENDEPTNWRVENGELVNDQMGGAELQSDREFGDCELLLEIKKNKDAQWKTLKALKVGDKFSTPYHGLVDMKTSDQHKKRNLPFLESGAIRLPAIFGEGQQIYIRSVSIRELEPAEANKMLADQDSEQFKKVFNGVDFEGWDGPVDQYEIVDGVLRCKPNSGGTIFTKKEYSDFSVRFEFKLPPGGNNGLAIRYPGEGDTAYVGMCELQVLDNDAKKYANLDKRQYHGSAYGMAAAERGYLRPQGQWNFQQVTVKGSKIQVELNGVTILQADLAKVDDFLADKAHPGKDRASGHFGFAGHNDPVEFRNVSIHDLSKTETDE